MAYLCPEKKNERKNKFIQSDGGVGIKESKVMLSDIESVQGILVSGGHGMNL